jgi:hypothetical protein
VCPPQIQQLEAEVEKASARASEAERQAGLRDAELASVRHEGRLWRAVKEAECAQLALSVEQLGKQLEREMARAAGLEEQLAGEAAAKVRTRQGRSLLCSRRTRVCDVNRQTP